MDPLARALRFTRSVEDAACDEVRPIAQGSVLRTPSLPDAWSANALRLEAPLPGVTLADVERLGAAHQTAPYLHVRVEDEATADRLLAEADGVGAPWTTECELVMVLEPERPVPAGAREGAVREGTLDEVLGLVDAWLTEEGHPSATVEQLVARTRREHAVLPERLLVADHDGRPAAMCTVRLGEAVAQVEDVFVLAAARRTGLGGAVTAAGARAAAQSGAEVVFIVADDRDWPKQLYTRIGFAPCGRRANLHRAAR